MRALIDSFTHHIKDEDLRIDLYRDAIIAFEDEDWDGADELVGKDPAFDKALEELDRA